MEWFSVWWDSLEILQQILFCVALPASLVLLIQIILMLLGFSGAGEGIDISDTSGLDGFDGDIPDETDINLANADGSAPGDFNVMGLFSIQGIVSFLCVFGWSGLAFTSSGLHPAVSLIIAFALGFGAMVGVAVIIRMSSKLVHNGTFNIKTLLGESATVYLAIPAGNNGRGKVTVQLSERYMEFDAVTEETSTLENNTAVRITDILAGNILVVEKIN